MTRRRIAIVGSGFSGSLLARILARLGHEVVLLERGSHPRFAIGESTTPLANLSLERLARRYDLPDCHALAAHGRWLSHHPDLRRGIKRGFTFYRHHPHADDAERLAAERLLVAANPSAAVADTHWLRADVDHHFVREAIAAGVDYRDRTEIVDGAFSSSGARLHCVRDNSSFEVQADFVVDASGPSGFIARQLSVPSDLGRTLTRSGVLFSHFTNVAFARDAFRSFTPGPYDDDWAAVHHIIDEGWMYSLRFDDDVVSAGFVLRDARQGKEPAVMWRSLLDRYPTISTLFADAKPLFPLVHRDRIQHRLTRSVGERWAVLPHAYAFVDPLFSTGIAWSLRAIERLALSFEQHGLPTADDLSRYDALLRAEADQIDVLVAGAYEAMKRFDLFAAHAMIYFAAVSYAEVRQRVVDGEHDRAPWSGFIGVGDPVLEALPSESLRRLRGGDANFAEWVRAAIAPRNIGGFGDATRNNLYPVDLDLLVDGHALLGMTRQQLIARLPELRGLG